MAKRPMVIPELPVIRKLRRQAPQLGSWGGGGGLYRGQGDRHKVSSEAPPTHLVPLQAIRVRDAIGGTQPLFSLGTLPSGENLPCN